jgi:hypothetical protein
MKLSTIAFAFASTLALVKCIVFFDGIKLDGNNEGGGSVVLFCLINGLVGFTYSNDCFASTLFCVLCLFVVDPRKLRNTNVKKETC